MIRSSETSISAAAYSRANPSPRYTALVDIYRRLHAEGDLHNGIPADSTFDGRSLLPHLSIVKQAIDGLGARTILDYGAGKGQQYQPIKVKGEGSRVFPDVKSFWGVDEIVCYDPAYTAFSTLPDCQFDGVICTDVLEHIPEEDIPWVLDELFAHARLFVFATVALYRAAKVLPNGDNAHCTLRPTEWWCAAITRAAADRPGLHYRFEFYRGSPTNRDTPPPPPELFQR